MTSELTPSRFLVAVSAEHGIWNWLPFPLEWMNVTLVYEFSVSVTEMRCVVFALIRIVPKNHVNAAAVRLQADQLSST